MRKFLINISRWYKMQSYYIDAYKDLYLNYDIKTYIFFDKNLISKMIESNSEEYSFFYYESINDLIRQLKDIEKSDIYYINTFDELLVLDLNEIKKELWFFIPDKFEAFRNKNLQRELLLKKFPETTVSFFELDIINEQIDSYYNKLDFPYIIKPTSWMQSSWVLLINNKIDLENYVQNTKSLFKNMLNRWISDTKLILEEYIDWDMFTVDYFVDDNWTFIISIITKVFLLKNLWIDDFGNYVRISGDLINSYIDLNLLNDFIKKHIITFWIRNTFIHHEFKINSKNIFKTIELNQRIWWYRVEMANLNYNYNILTSPLKIENNIKNPWNMAIFIFYPNKKWIFKWVNNDLLSKFKILNSFKNYRISESYIWKEIWLTKDWFSNVAAIRIINYDSVQFKKDFDFIEKNYNHFIILE